MPVLQVSQAATRAQDEKVAQVVDLDGQTPTGLICHAVAETPSSSGPLTSETGPSAFPPEPTKHGDPHSSCCETGLVKCQNTSETDH